MHSVKLLIIASLVMFAAPVFASGGGSYGGGGGLSAPQPRAVDRAYEYGKAIYQGRVKEVGKIQYCVKQGEETVKLKRGSLKPYKGGTVNDLAQNLYDCKMPEDRIADRMSQKNLQFVLYYLNKRYKLKLS